MLRAALSAAAGPAKLISHVFRRQSLYAADRRDMTRLLIKEKQLQISHLKWKRAESHRPLAGYSDAESLPLEARSQHALLSDEQTSNEASEEGHGPGLYSAFSASQKSKPRLLQIWADYRKRRFKEMCIDYVNYVERLREKCDLRKDSCKNKAFRKYYHSIWEPMDLCVEFALSPSVSPSRSNSPANAEHSRGLHAFIALLNGEGPSSWTDFIENVLEASDHEKALAATRLLLAVSTDKPYVCDCHRLRLETANFEDV